MLIKSAILTGAIFLIIMIHIFAGGRVEYILYLFPVLELLAFYFVFIRSRSLAAIIFVGSFAMVLFGFSQTLAQEYLISACIGFLLLAVFFLYVRNWNIKVCEAEQKYQTTKREIKLLRDRYQSRVESLSHLEQQVSGLLNLFAMAKDFNECLSFAEVISVLHKSIAPQLSFVRGTMILVEPLDQSADRISRSLSFGPKKCTDDDSNAQFAGGCLQLLESPHRAEKMETEKDPRSGSLAAYGVNFPLWLFPLSAEHQLIAVLAVEGAHEHDFPKFEVLASQLALQVKKIRLYETVKELSIVDGLTQVFVRRHFLERFHEELKRAIRYGFPLTVLMVDVDHFKSYNDKFGHLVGDRTLKEVAQVIRENVRRVDVIGRYGGEEFIVVAPEIERSKGFELAERIRSSVAHRRLRIYDEETRITVSIGTSSFPNDLAQRMAETASEHQSLELIQKADQALYRAKEEGRNRVVAYS